MVDLYGDLNKFDPILDGSHLKEDDYEIVRLSYGANTALVGDFVMYRSQVTAGTPATHRDVEAAVAQSSDDQATANNWCGQIIEPVIKPDPVSGTEWNPDTALTDGILVKILKRGARARTLCRYTDASDNVLPGDDISISATEGEVRKTVNTFTDSTPTVNELANAYISGVMEYVGYADSVAEDVAGEDLWIAVNWGR